LGGDLLLLLIIVFVSCVGKDIVSEPSVVVLLPLFPKHEIPQCLSVNRGTCFSFASIACGFVVDSPIVLIYLPYVQKGHNICYIEPCLVSLSVYLLPMEGQCISDRE